MKVESLIEAARNDAAVTATSAARERVWNRVSSPRRQRSALVLFAASAAAGALLCLLIVRTVQPAHDGSPAAIAVLQGTVEPISQGHVKLAPGKAELTLRGGAEVELGSNRRVVVEEGVSQLRVAADGSGTVRVDSGSCLFTDSQGQRRLAAGSSLNFGQRLSEEVALYERGWSQLTADPKHALEAFDELLRRFPHGALVQEARLSRLEALQALKRPEVGAEARAFLKDFPDSERAAEVKKLLEEK